MPPPGAPAGDSTRSPQPAGGSTRSPQPAGGSTRSPQPAGGSRQPLRSDARDNRERILEAARAVFADEGFDAPMRSVADRAGVGPATLYRRFPTKQALVTEAFADRLHACHAIIERGLTDPDPWRGLRTVIAELFELHALDEGFARAFPYVSELVPARERSLTALAELAHRARSHLRPDFTLEDLILLLRANAGLRAPSAPARLAAARRFTTLAVQSLRPSSSAV
jgi:AcrR family transcriptional regulator